MKLTRIEVTNFASYKHLALDLDDTGLALIYGKTGCGKSTLMDMVFWTLYGVTSKGGAVDEVRAWQADGQPTQSVLSLEANGEPVTVVRIRGKSSENDLFWFELDPGALKRGKDITDTQRLLNERIGVDAELYTLAAYFHEFSPTTSFFTAKAKDRRAVFERIASLDLPVRLAERTSEARKTDKALLVELNKSLAKSTGKLEIYKQSLVSAQESQKLWELNHQALIVNLKGKGRDFDAVKAGRIAHFESEASEWDRERAVNIDHTYVALEEAFARETAMEKQLAETPKEIQVCPTCSQTIGDARKHEDERKELAQSLIYHKQYIKNLGDDLDEHAALVNPYTKQIETAKELENHYLEQAEQERKKVNPFDRQISYTKEEQAKEEAAARDLSAQVSDTTIRISALTQLYDLSFELRGAMLQRSVQDIQEETNRILETYFDGELRVGFALEGSDSLQVSIQKSGYECVYRQLSKGQRGMLKLAFAVSIMKAASNRAGVHFDNLFMDEALDGLDSDLKVQSFSLFEELAKDHGSVFVIEHSSEFKELFDKRYHVTMVGDESQVEDE